MAILSKSLFANLCASGSCCWPQWNRKLICCDQIYLCIVSTFTICAKNLNELSVDCETCVSHPLEFPSITENGKGILWTRIYFLEQEHAEHATNIKTSNSWEIFVLHFLDYLLENSDSWLLSADHGIQLLFFQNAKSDYIFVDICTCIYYQEKLSECLNFKALVRTLVAVPFLGWVLLTVPWALQLQEVQTNESFVHLIPQGPWLGQFLRRGWKIRWLEVVTSEEWAECHSLGPNSDREPRSLELCELTFWACPRKVTRKSHGRPAGGFKFRFVYFTWENDPIWLINSASRLFKWVIDH